MKFKFWEKDNTDSIVIDIPNVGVYEVTPPEIVEFYELNFNGTIQEDSGGLYLNIARLVAISKLKEKLIKDRQKINDNITTLNSLYRTRFNTVRGDESPDDDDYTKYAYETETVKLDENEFDSFINKFCDKAFVERMKEEDILKKRSNSTYDRMKQNADFWSKNGNGSYSGNWESVLKLKDQDNITKDMVLKQFRTLVMVHHPDRGGDPKEFQRLVEAKEQAFQQNGWD